LQKFLLTINKKYDILLLTKEKGVLKMKNTWKMETSKDFTAWDLNGRHIVPHKKRDNKLEKVFRRKNRRKVKKALDNLLKSAII
jgi:surfactin synthase thioesterase subunit